jgi:uracil-DNA glycosylase family 4
MSSLRQKEVNFERLIEEAKACTLCPRMLGSTRVVGAASGALDSRIFMIGEAPGRLGADMSAIPFHGDQSGENFERLLEQVGLSRHDCFITNAAICNPKDDNGNNATPTRAELRNCSSFLKRQIDLVDPEIVATLGAQSLAALRSIEDHDIDLASGVRKKWRWYGRSLVPLYHPGQRAMVHRSFLNQLADYRFLAETYARRSQKKMTAASAAASSVLVAQIVARLLKKTGQISYFALHKLFYLAEYEFYKRTRRRMTAAYIVRQKDGPYVFELNVKKLKKALEELEIRSLDNHLLLSLGSSLPLFNSQDELDEEVSSIVDYIASKYGNESESELKRVVYLTSPMRAILRREMKLRENTFNRPIDFSVIAPG